MPFAMSAAEREQFLAGLHVGVLSVAVPGGEGPGGRAPLAVPVWYDYQEGGQVSVITGRSSRKGLAIRAAGRMSLCAQDEKPPYRYVSVEGPVVIEDLDPAERLAMARRYLGAQGGDQYVAGNPDPAGENIMIRMRPEHWLSVDYGKSS
jgi:nitroimidazol reductase NimA-like FMN-containing flavoprotein (pyridoxamine 5'-phosphate oxidase superfamily)